ncbi:MAG: glycosyltransferase family 4 protein [Bacteroides sp.]|nr:glycosyltransferase family 4 protein [Bacteroides sp.]MCM1548420.1 glycosyltransferase family 4 protein [Clostridium sp.]
MRVLYIASGDSKYGASKSMVEVMLSMKKQYDIEPVLLTRKANRLNQMCDKLGIENYVFWNRDIMAGSAYSNPLLNILKHLVKYGLYLYGGMRQSGVSKIGLDFSGIDLIHSNLNRNDIGVWIAKKYNIPHIWHLRELGKEDYRVQFYKPNCIDYLNQNADAFIAISKCVAKAWKQRGIQEKKIYLVYNGIDISQFEVKKKQDDALVKLVMSGHIQLTKGQDQLIQAIGLLEDEYKSCIQVDFYGEAYPDYKKQLDKYVKEYHLEELVHFCGYCDHLPQKLSEYDIGVICSRAEGFGRVTVEYMAANLAVLASDTGANPELIEEGISGVLYPYNDIEALADRIRYMVKNPEERRRIARQGRKRVQERYTTEKNVEGIYQVYQTVIKNRGKK